MSNVILQYLPSVKREASLRRGVIIVLVKVFIAGGDAHFFSPPPRACHHKATWDRDRVIETSVTDGWLSYGWTNHWSANYLVDDAIVACVGGVICSGTGRVRRGLLWLSGKGFQSRFGMSRGQSNHRDCSRACNNFKMCMRYVLKRHCSQFAYVALTVPRFLRWWW